MEIEIFKGLSTIEFNNCFSTEEKCMEYLSNLKWEYGYQCRKCKHTQHGKGYKPFSRRCKQCGYDESVTAGTLFEKCKIGLLKAFHGLYLVTTQKKGISSVALSEQLSINQKSAWLLRCKAQQVMKSSHNYPLTQIVEVDEFGVGGPAKGKPGRTLDGKKQTLMMTEIRKDKKGNNVMGRAYAVPIENFKGLTILEVMQKYIDPEAQVQMQIKS